MRAVKTQALPLVMQSYSCGSVRCFIENSEPDTGQFLFRSRFQLKSRDPEAALSPAPTRNPYLRSACGYQSSIRPAAFANSAYFESGVWVSN
jgi:hypothetical protein